MALEMYVHPVPHTSAVQPPTHPRRWGRWFLAVLFLVGLALGLVGLLANAVLVGRMERIDGAFSGLGERPADTPGRTFLMVGTRPGTAGADVPWLDGRQSVEAVMLIEVAEDGMSARVDTLPGRSGAASVATKALPGDTVATVEAWSGRRVDHLIAIDWTTFERLAEHNGVDPSYTYGSGPAAQHEFLQRVMEGTLHQELRKRPLDLYRVLRTTVDGTAVDDGWTVIDLDLLLFSLRNLRSAAITYATAEAG